MPKIKNLPAEITENSAYDFSIKESGIYLIEIIASCKNWRQNWAHLFNDDDLAVKIDNIEFPKLNKKNGLLNGEAAWNGNNLKGAKKIGIFVLNLKSGDHQINFIPNANPRIHSINIVKVENNIIEYAPAEENKQAEDGNNRQWITIALNNLPLKNLYINANYIWRIYKDGVDFNGETKNILWINKKGGFAFLKLIITIGVILAIGGLGYYFGIKGYYKEQAANIAKEETSVQEIYETVDKTFLNDFEIYKKGEVQYGDFFKDTLKECERIGCIKQSVVYEKYKIIIENMKNNNHFLSAINSLGAENLFHLNDIDNDGENEIIFLMYDPLNRDNIAISVIDKIDGKFALVEKNIKWGHSGHLAVLDVTGDLKPEIISYISFGKGGESLFIYQYSYPNFKEIFNVNDLLYSEYILSDIDNDKKIEIRVIGQDQDPLNDYRTEIKRIYEYNPMQNSFLLIDSGGN